MIINRYDNRGRERRYAFHHYSYLTENRLVGEKAIHYKTGKWKNNGYVYVRNPEHPRTRSDGYVLEHILVMEKHLGRHLTKDESVHHKNKKRDDNRIENLELFSKLDHHYHHLKERWRKYKENKIPIRNCKHCNGKDTRKEGKHHRNKSIQRFYCNECKRYFQ